MENSSPNLRAYTLLAAAILVLCLGYSTDLRAQKVVDKIVATVNDGVKTELITYSDLRWQLALQPGPTLTPPSSEDLNRALQTLIDQRLFSLEAERIPRSDPTEEKRRSRSFPRPRNSKKGCGWWALPPLRTTILCG
jgi:hypothetical protein